MWGKSQTENGTAKPSGLDMMIQTLLRNMGVTPDTLLNYIETGKKLAEQFVAAMTGTENHLAHIRTEQLAQREMLQRILSGMLPAPGVAELYPAEFDWECETCKRAYAEYVNGCPACWENGEIRSKVVHVKRGQPDGR